MSASHAVEYTFLRPRLMILSRALPRSVELRISFELTSRSSRHWQETSLSTPRWSSASTTTASTDQFQRQRHQDIEAQTVNGISVQKSFSARM